MDFSALKQTPILVFSNLVMLLLLFYILKPALRSPFLIDSKKQNTTLFLCCIFCLFSFWGLDWFGYLSYFINVKAGWGDHVAMEDVYIWLMEQLPNYILFRLIVWGGALTLLCLTIKRLQISKGLFWFFFVSIYLIYFSYARATLAMAFMFCGVTYLYSRNKNKMPSLVNIIVGCTLIGCSYYFHKSSAIGIVAIFMALALYFAKSKKTILLLTFSFPFAVLIAQVLFSDYFNMIMNDDSNLLNEYATTGSVHLENDKNIIGWGTTIQFWLERLPYYLLTYVSIKSLTKQEHPNEMKLMMYVLCSLVFVASLFAFDLGINTETLYGRTLRYAQIPACICLTYFYQNGIFPKLVKATFRTAIFGCFYSVIYVLYNTIVG